MKLTINRGPSLDDGTFSKATLDDGTVYDWLELPWRDNAQGRSCIPTGTYRALPKVSPHFGVMVYELALVPGRSYVEIHPGNWAGDSVLGLYSDLLGCMSPGFGVGVLQPPEQAFKPQKALLNSRKAFNDFMQRTGAALLEITIVGFDTPGAK